MYKKAMGVSKEEVVSFIRRIDKDESFIQVDSREVFSIIDYKCVVDDEDLRSVDLFTRSMIEHEIENDPDGYWLKSAVEDYLDSWIFVNAFAIIHEAVSHIYWVQRNSTSYRKAFPEEKYAHKIDCINTAIKCYFWASGKEFPTVRKFYDWFKTYPKGVPEYWADRMYTEL